MFKSPSHFIKFQFSDGLAFNLISSWFEGDTFNIVSCNTSPSPFMNIDILNDGKFSKSSEHDKKIKMKRMVYILTYSL